MLNSHAGGKKPVYRPHLRKPFPLTQLPGSQYPNTAKLSSLLLPRTLTFAANTNIPLHSRPSLDQTMNDGKKGRRRRSSSLIIYQEPLESPEHMSDQSALPNLNATWVNAKGTIRLPNLHYGPDEYTLLNTASDEPSSSFFTRIQDTMICGGLLLVEKADCMDLKCLLSAQRLARYIINELC